MTTLTMRPTTAAERQSTSITRSKTHPLHDSSLPIPNSSSRPKARPRSKIKQGEPFDPAELTRRLEAHLITQKLASQRRRDARAAKAAAAAPPPSQVIYHHVPKVAASAFERTTTPDVMRQIHKLAQSVVKQSREAPGKDVKEKKRTPLSQLKRTQARDQALIDQNLERERNNFQSAKWMEKAEEVNLARDLYSPPQRTFVAEFAHLRPSSPPTLAVPKGDGAQRRPLSMGDLLAEEEKDADGLRARKTRTVPIYDPRVDRNDWVQRDDVEDEKEKEKEKEKELKRLSSPTEKDKVRKKESTWGLRGWKSPRSDKEKEDAISPPASLGNLASSPTTESVKTGRASFLARFKKSSS